MAVRFTNLPIPRGAPILSAWIQFQTDEASTAPAALTIHAEASDAAAPFTTLRSSLGARPRTTASVAWNPAPWLRVRDSGAAQRTPDLSPLVQEIVSRGGWSNTNPLVFFFSGSGARVAEAFEGTATGAPLLHIVFGGTAGNLGPSVSAGPDRTIDPSQTLVLDGSALDEGLPNGQLFPFWSEVSGPGNVVFADPGALDTTALFSEPGNYILRLTVSDGEFVGQDDVLVTVIDPTAAATVERRITVGSDDIEERISNGTMYLTGSDLELGVDGANAQLLGLRFPNLAIPPGANIKTAWIQFMADETGASAATFTVRAEASANPVTFTAAVRRRLESAAHRHRRRVDAGELGRGRRGGRRAAHRRPRGAGAGAGEPPGLGHGQRDGVPRDRHGHAHGGALRREGGGGAVAPRRVRAVGQGSGRARACASWLARPALHLRTVGTERGRYTRSSCALLRLRRAPGPPRSVCSRLATVRGCGEGEGTAG